MANTLTGLIPDIYEALDQVSRELTGYIPAVSRDSGIERAAVGQNVRVPVTTEVTAQDTIPSANAPNTGDTNVDHVDAQITKSRHVPVRWNGEETKGLSNAGTFSTIQADRFYQAMRTLVNEIESDVHVEAYKMPHVHLVQVVPHHLVQRQIYLTFQAYCEFLKKMVHLVLIFSWSLVMLQLVIYVVSSLVYLR